MTRKRFYKLVMAFGYSAREARRKVKRCQESRLPYEVFYKNMLPLFIIHGREAMEKRIIDRFWKSLLYGERLTVESKEETPLGVSVVASLQREGGEQA